MSIKTLPTLPTMVLQQSSSVLRFDQTRVGWTFVKDVVLEGERKLQLDTFLREGESYLVGHTMLERANQMGDCAGQLHAERMLEQQENIPVEWREFRLLFPGTVWRLPLGRLYVPYLYWHAGGWRLYWYWLGLDFNDCRLVRFGK